MNTSHQERARQYDRRLRRFGRMLGLVPDLVIEYVAEIVCQGPLVSLRYRNGILQGYPQNMQNGQPMAQHPLADSIPAELPAGSTSWAASGLTGIRGRLAEAASGNVGTRILVAHDILRKDLKPSATQIGIYEILHGWGFQIPPYLRLCSGAGGIIQHLSGAREEAMRCGMRVASVRYRINDLLLQERLLAISGSTESGLGLTISLRE